MVGESELIRVKTPTKLLLSELKIVDDESFDSVISRILQTKFEDHLELNEATATTLKQRIEKMRKGDVFSGDELLDRVRKKRGL